MATELLQPGVSVIQEFRSVSPTIVTPTLAPCAIAPAFQILEALTPDAAGNSALNTDAVASVPAILTASNPAPYAGLDGLALVVSVNNGAEQTFTFSDPTSLNLDAGQVKDQIQGATTAPAGFGAFVVTRSGQSYLQLRTTAKGTGQTIKILGGGANSILGFNTNFIAEGVSNYSQASVHVEQDNFPDPRAIIDELDIDEASIRVFINTGSALKETKRTETFLRKLKSAIYTSAAITFPTTALTSKKFSFRDGVGGAVQEYTFAGEAANVAALVTAMNTLIGSNKVVANGATKIDFITTTGYVEILTPSASSGHGIIGWTDDAKAYTLVASDDSDGDTKTPFILVPRDNFTTPPGSAKRTGTAALTGQQAIHNLTFEAQLDGGHLQDVIFDGGPIVGGAVFNASNTITGETLAFSVNGTAKTVTFSGANPVSLASAITQINAAAGVTVAYESNSTGVPGAGGYLAFRVGGASPSAGGVVVLTYQGAGDDNTWTDLGYASSIGGNVQQTLSLSEIITQINATFGVGFAAAAGSYVELNATSVGAQSSIAIGNGTANSLLGFVAGGGAYGAPCVPKVGDAVWADGALIGYVALVAPGGNSARLKLDREVSTSYGASAFYIQALNIATPVPAGRPTPDLVIDAAGAVNVKANFLRDTEGNPIASASGQLIIAYKALRLDLSQASSTPSLLSLESTVTLEDALAPVNADNPLALMLYFMLINAPGILVTGLGVDGVSSSNPDGTPESYSRALSFLESQEVYALAPASQDATVHQIFATHVTSMSEPDAKGERIVLINPAIPGEALPTLVVSGTDGDSTAVANEFDTKLPSLAADVLAAGINPVGTQDVSVGLYLDLASDSKRYNIASISGTKITIRVAFAPGENDDGFYTTTNLPSTLISETFSINVRGSALVDSLGKPDYVGIALAYQKLGQSYGNRRVVMVAPNEVGASIGGLEQKIKGYYLCAAVAGMVGQLPPQQGFTNYPITGFSKVYGSNDVFNQRQMNIGAAGGTYWVVQEIAGGPLSCRHQLTTDLTSIETRELSITKIVDFASKFMRAGLRNFIGKFNITQPFLDTLSTVVQGQLSFLADVGGTILGGDLNNIIQDKSAPDTVLIDVTLDVPYPCNYIRLTLVI